jgi:hypothetical protein
VLRDLPGFDASEPVLDPREAAAARFRELLEERSQVQTELALARTRFVDWVGGVPEATGPVDASAEGRFPYLAELYGQRGAHDREQVYAKGAQVGISTLAIRLGLFHADVFARKIVYCFPTDIELREFSRHRIKPAIEASAHLRSRMSKAGVDNVALRQIGHGWWFGRGLSKPVESIDCDLLILDELDSADQANVEASEWRVSGPHSAGMIRRIGVPSVPGFGISQLYEESDQRVWSCRCECGTWNPIRGLDAFEHNVDQERMLLVCRECRRPLDVRAGEWVPTYPDRDVRGYHLPKLIAPGQRLEVIVKNSRKTRPDQVQAFHNRDLGEGFSPADSRLSLEQVRACVDPELRPLTTLASSNLVTAGIDVASSRPLTVVIEEAIGADRGRKVFVGEIDDRPDGPSAFQQLDQLMDAFGVTLACIDHMPEARLAEAFAQRWPGRVWRVSYFTPQPSPRQDPPPWNVDSETCFASVWRTRVLDFVLERFRQRRVLLPPLETLPSGYAPELGNIVRRTVEHVNGVRAEYVKTGPDDFAHAEAYNAVAIALVDLLHARGALQRQLSQPYSLADQLDFVPVDLGWDSEPEYDPGPAIWPA